MYCMVCFAMHFFSTPLTSVPSAFRFGGSCDHNGNNMDGIDIVADCSDAVAGMKPKVRDHYHAHRLSIWNRLIPKLHRAGAGGAALSRDHHLLEDFDNQVSTGRTFEVTVYSLGRRSSSHTRCKDAPKFSCFSEPLALDTSVPLQCFLHSCLYSYISSSSCPAIA